MNGTTNQNAVGLKPLEIVTISFYGVITPVTIFGNGVVILAVSFIKSLRTPSNFLIVSLAFADLCIGLITIPLRATEILGPDFTSTIEFCRVAHAFTLLNVTASISNLTIITIDRYLAILHPYLYYHLCRHTKRYVGGMVAAAWLVVILMTFLPLYGWGSNGESGKRKGPMGICRFHETLSPRFLLLILISVIVTSFFVIIPMYARIFIIARKQIRKIKPVKLQQPTDITSTSSESTSGVKMAPVCKLKTDPPSTRRSLNTENDRVYRVSLMKTVKTMFLIVIIFLLSWITFFVSTLMFIICKNCASSAVVLPSTVAIYIGSAINPFVYFIRIKKFRDEIRRVWNRMTF